MEESKELAVYFKDGNVAYFNNVTRFKIDEYEDIIKFNYFGIASQLNRSACFNTNVIAGYSLSE